MLKLNSLATAGPVVIDHGLEDHVVARLQAENTDLQIQRDFSALESYVDKHDGMVMMSQVLNSIPVLSIESAALTEVASAILARGTDLSGVDDFVPGLEAHVVAGLEDEDKGNGFAEKAKKVGVAILEKLKQLWDKMIASLTSVGSKMGKLKDSLVELKDRISQGDDYAYELPMYRYNALVDPDSKAIMDFIAKGTITNPTDVAKASEDDSGAVRGLTLGAVFSKMADAYLDVLKPLSTVKDGTLELTELDTDKILVLTPPTVVEGKIDQGTVIDKRDRADDELKKGRLTKDQLTAGIMKIMDAADKLQPWFDDIAKVNKQISEDIKKLDPSQKSLRENMQIAKLHFFTYTTVPGAIYDVFAAAADDARKIING